MLKKEQKKFSRPIYCLTAILIGIAAFATFQIQRSQAQTAGEVVNMATAAPAFIDAAFNPVLGGSNGQIVDSFVQADGKILIGGLFNTVSGVNRNSLARFNTDGSLDTTFNLGAGETMRSTVSLNSRMERSSSPVHSRPLTEPQSEGSHVSIWTDRSIKLLTRRASV